MFNWEGCPPELFDLYIEVGDVLPGESEDSRQWIEVWIPDRYAKDVTRPGCAQIRRRPIYGLVKQIEKLCGPRKAALRFMGDDTPSPHAIDPESWGGAIGLLLGALQARDRLDSAVLYTGKTLSQIRHRQENRTEQEQREFQRLFQSLDLLVTEKPNRYAPGSGTVTRLKDTPPAPRSHQEPSGGT